MVHMHARVKVVTMVKIVMISMNVILEHIHVMPMLSAQILLVTVVMDMFALILMNALMDKVKIPK